MNNSEDGFVEELVGEIATLKAQLAEANTVIFTLATELVQYASEDEWAQGELGGVRTDPEYWILSHVQAAVKAMNAAGLEVPAEWTKCVRIGEAEDKRRKARNNTK